MTIKPRERIVDSDEDPVESMLKKTGCLELHYKVQVHKKIICEKMCNEWATVCLQDYSILTVDCDCKIMNECIAETKDWRKCQDAVNNFRDCINKHQKQKGNEIKT